VGLADNSGKLRVGNWALVRIKLSKEFSSWDWLTVTGCKRVGNWDMVRINVGLINTISKWDSMSIMGCKKLRI